MSKEDMKAEELTERETELVKNDLSAKPLYKWDSVLDGNPTHGKGLGLQSTTHIGLIFHIIIYLMLLVVACAGIFGLLLSLI